MAPLLERCVRLLPHRDDCGGFFVAAFRRAPEEALETAPEEALETAFGASPPPVTDAGRYLPLGSKRNMEPPLTMHATSESTYMPRSRWRSLLCSVAVPGTAPVTAAPPLDVVVPGTAPVTAAPPLDVRVSYGS